MTQVKGLNKDMNKDNKDMTNSELNRALAELMGNKIGRKVDYGFKPEYDRDVIALPNDRYKFIPDYCTDPAASLEVQTAAIARDRDDYLNNLTGVVTGYYPKSINWDIEWENDVIAQLIQATPRERAEAAYLTLQGQ